MGPAERQTVQVIAGRRARVVSPLTEIACYALDSLYTCCFTCLRASRIFACLFENCGGCRCAWERGNANGDRAADRGGDADHSAGVAPSERLGSKPYRDRP